MDKLYDAVIAGGGPAGLTAAIYMARARYRVLVIEKEKFGGQITITSEVVNYPGILETDGTKLTETMRIQAENFGAEFLSAEISDINLEEDIRVIKTEKGEIRTLGMILATGASPRTVGFTGEEEFRGRGVAYCATCDGEFFTGLDIFVVGGGYAAAEEAVFLTKYGRKVTILVRKGQFSCADSIVREVMNHPDIEVRFHTEIIEAGGENSLQYAILKNNETGETYRYEAEKGKTFGIFVFAGYAPATELFRDKVNLNKNGYLITDRNQKTNVDGVYGAGDVCEKELRQVVTAVSDGAVAGTSLEKYISGMYEKLNLTRRSISVQQSHRQQVQGQETAGQIPEGEGFITGQMKVQLEALFDKFETALVLKGYIEDNTIGQEIRGFLNEIDQISDNVSCEIYSKEKRKEINYPSICICDSSGNDLGVQFHGVPGGHEFNSFIIALYNAAGPGKPFDEADAQRMKKISGRINLKVIVSLSCTMCPELVMTAQKIALESPGVEAEMYDLSHFPDIKEKYQIMSVPCLIITNTATGDEQIYFGKKTTSELLDLLADGKSR